MSRLKEEKMRIPILAFAGMLCLAAGSQSTNGTPLPPSGSLLASASKAIPAAHPSCPKGQRWVPAGYAKHGKYRVGHCAPR
jgi:hypothetical protein